MTTKQDYRYTAAPIIKEFLNYHDAIKNHSQNTVDSYYEDLKMFIAWLHNRDDVTKLKNNFKEDEITLETLGAVKRTDIYDFMTWLKRDHNMQATSISRILSTIRSLYYYLSIETKQLSEDPTIGISNPKTAKKLPIYLDIDQAEKLLNVNDGVYALRDRTILMLFLTCGLRVSEVANLNLDNISKEYVRVHGKGNKERIVYFSPAMQKQMQDYLEMRYTLQNVIDKDALFLSQRHKRISVRRIQTMVSEKMKAAGLDDKKYSPHKLRHTAATVMIQNGVDVRIVQDILGHENLNTTQIYTHVDDTDLRLAASVSPFGKNEIE